jgi:hypothetical protein
MRPLFFIVFYILMAFTTHSQNLFDGDNSQKYAAYLYSSGEYAAAAHELERVVFLQANSPNQRANDSLHATLLSAYRLSKNAPMGIQRATQIFENTDKMPALVAFEYGKLLVQNKNFGAADGFFRQNNYLTPHQQNYLIGSTHALQNQWQPARLQYQTLPVELYPQATDLLQITQQGIDFKTKKPLVAAVFSGIVPGMGKVYSHDWKDGLVSLVFIGSMAFQSYRGYQQKGLDSPRFWIYTTLGTGFYIANIYGSYQSARQYNQKFYGNLNHQIADIFYQNK